MIQSMTGYGKADVTYNGKKIHVEIKSLNSKALDLSTRIAPLYREKEMELRKLIQGGGVSLNKEKVADPYMVVGSEQLIAGKYLLVQKGKKNYYIIIAE